MRVLHSLLASAAASACLLAQSAPCFETNIGSNIGASDDTVSYAFPLGFSFPGPGGNYTDIDISSNGFIWLGTNAGHTSDCCNGDASMFVANDPRIAGAWMDLYPPGAVAGGGVFFNAIPASGSDPARAVVTWYRVPEFYDNPLVTVQVQLIATGEIKIYHEGSNAIPGHVELVGVTQGLGATSNVVNFGTIPPGGTNTGSNPTALQLYTAPPNYDLAGDVIWFIPNSQGGYLILLNNQCARYTTFGAGCLNSPVTFYEDFTTPSFAFDLSNSTISLINAGTSYLVNAIPGAPAWFTPTSTALTAGPYAFSWYGSWDEAVSNPISLPWTLNYPTGSTSTISVGSNGIIYLGTPTPYVDDVYFGDYLPGWLGTGPSLAVAYGDQDTTVNPAYGIYYDVDPSGNAVYITWNTSEYSYGTPQDFQVMIDVNGNIEYRYLNVGIVGTPTVVGWCPGGGPTDPGSIDLSTVGTFLTGDGSLATTLTNTAGALPTLGSTFSQDVGNIRPGSLAGLMFYGFGNLLPTGFSLAPYGAPGCTQWINLLVNQLFLVSGSTTAVAIPIPNTPSLVGLILQSQAAVLSPGVNSLGAVVSNGAAMTLGF